MGRLIIAIGILALLADVVMLSFALLAAPQKSAPQEVFVIEKSQVNDVVALLAGGGYIRDPRIFSLVLSMRGGEGAEPGAYTLSRSMNAWEVSTILLSPPIQKQFTLPLDLDASQIAVVVANGLGWSEQEGEEFSLEYINMRNTRVHSELSETIGKIYNWVEYDKKVFQEMFSEVADEFFGGMYNPGMYLVDTESTREDVAELLVNRFLDGTAGVFPALMAKKGEGGVIDTIALLVRREAEYTPDLIMEPPADLSLKKKGGKTKLLFSTTYRNTGEGALELIADEKDNSVRGDTNRKIYQRIYRKDGSYRDKLAGKFFWEQSHKHYHFTDFANYTLQPISQNSRVWKRERKIGFCVRDIVKGEKDLSSSPSKAVYKVCSSEKQGVSVGWGDTYYSTYPNQSIDVTGLPTGTYRLIFEINPLGRFDEISMENNINTTLLYINVSKGVVKEVEG